MGGDGRNAEGPVNGKDILTPRPSPLAIAPVELEGVTWAEIQRNEGLVRAAARLKIGSTALST